MKYEDNWWVRILESMSPENSRWDGWPGTLSSREASTEFSSETDSFAEAMRLLPFPA